MHDEAWAHGPTYGPVAPSGDADHVWTGVWQALVALLRRWGKQVCDAEDIASEAVTRTLQRLGRAVPWRDLWAWAVRTARSLFVEFWRVAQRERIEDVNVGTLFDADQQADQAVFIELRDRVEGQLSQDERASFQMLLAGASNEEVAGARRISGRAMRSCRSKIREVVARTLGNDA